MAPSHSVGGKHELFSPQPPIMNENWAKCYGPRFITDESGRTRLITRMCSTLGAPPVMVAEMTPTTSAPNFVACIMNAGYHVELATAGSPAGHEELVASMPKARGITCNVIYANPRAISWQIPLLRRLQAEGYPIGGLCIGAGVLSPRSPKSILRRSG
jgi:fatty acid synthase subunit beta